MLTIVFNADGTRTETDDGIPDPPAQPDVFAELSRLEAVAAKVAQRTGLTQAEAEALAKSAAAISKG